MLSEALISVEAGRFSCQLQPKSPKYLQNKVTLFYRTLPNDSRLLLRQDKQQPTEGSLNRPD